MNVAVTARAAGRLTLNIFTDRLVSSTAQDVKPGTGEREARRRQGLGHRRLSGRHAAPSARCAGRSACRAAPSACSGFPSIGRRARSPSSMDLPSGAAAEFDARRAGACRGLASGRRGARRRRRGRCRHPQPHQLQAAGARRLLSRPAPAHRRNPRHLRAVDRRHAGRGRQDPQRRRYRRASNSPARRRRRRRSRSIPASSPSAATASRKWPSTSPPSPAPCA